ncbi:glutathione S-transferase theta-1-like [Protopterus annectens]|uniref:glutathione S-transferase theta-1-like n=1 Tax=Protopterus annectens TaxID=7888 RepID=UPI001CFB73D0|nr:glutathione S-transferase theta-1-like [Protopterus annectens]
MTGLQVYVDRLSQPSRAVLIFLRVNNISHTEIPVALRRGEQKTPEFTKLNPMQKVPVIVENGFVLTESDAILKYLATKEGIPDHWYPCEPQHRAKVDEYTAWHHTNTRIHAAKVFIHEVLLPRMTGQPTDQKKLASLIASLDGTLDKLETMFLKDQAFLCGHDITLADLLAICELTQLLASGHDALKNRPKLLAWQNRVKSALGDEFDEVNNILYRLRDKAKL